MCSKKNSKMVIGLKLHPTESVFLLVRDLFSRNDGCFAPEIHG